MVTDNLSLLILLVWVCGYVEEREGTGVDMWREEKGGRRKQKSRCA